MLDQTAEAVRWLHVEKGLRPGEIASRLKLTPSAVSNALRRAGVWKPGGRAAIQELEFLPRQEAKTAEKRDPCIRCGVRYDLHDDLGCKRWRAL